MAKVTGILAFYFFFNSIVGIIKFLVKRSGRHVTGTVVSVSDPQSTSERKVIKYIYDIDINGATYHYTEKKSKGEAPSFASGTSVELLVNEEKSSVMTLDEYNGLKKGLYMNPIYCVGCILLTVLLIYIASAI